MMMLNWVRRSGMVVGLVLTLIWTKAGEPVYAENGLPSGGQFTILVTSAYVRSAPDPASDRVFSVFAGESYPVVERSHDGRWVRVSNWRSALGWLPSEYGLWRPSGAASDEELATARAARARSVPRVPPEVISSFSDEARAIYERGIALGNNPNVFAKVGDCNSENGRFLVMFEVPGTYTLGERYAFLQETIDYYAGSWERTSVAAQSGFSPASVMDPVFADPEQCNADEGPLLCEYRLIRPSVAIIALGTHYAPTMAQYEADMRVVIEESIHLGVVPILATKADDVEGGDRINPIIRALAAEYEVPLWDFWLAAQPLPNAGLASTRIHPSYAPPVFDDPWVMQKGWPWRNLTALLALDSVRQGVADGLSTPGRAGR
jgi:hypothetical protein